MPSMECDAVSPMQTFMNQTRDDTAREPDRDTCLVPPLSVHSGLIHAQSAVYTIQRGRGKTPRHQSRKGCSRLHAQRPSLPLSPLLCTRPRSRMAHKGNTILMQTRLKRTSGHAPFLAVSPLFLSCKDGKDMQKRKHRLAGRQTGTSHAAISSLSVCLSVCLSVLTALPSPHHTTPHQT